MIKLNSPGKRIMHVRKLSGLSRSGFQDASNISQHTIQSWELEKSILTEKGAAKLAEAINQLGITCSKQWLLSGKGPSPSLQTSKESSLDNKLTIDKEIETFLQFNDEAIVVATPDDGVDPYISKGTYVGGIKTQQYSNLINKICIVETNDERTLIRKLMKDGDGVILVCTNPSTKQLPVLKNIKLKYAAQIIWQRIDIGS